MTELVLLTHFQPNHCIIMERNVWGWEWTLSDIKDLQRRNQRKPRRRKWKKTKEKLRFLLLEEFTTPPTGSQQVRNLFYLIYISHIHQCTCKWGSAGCGYHSDRPSLFLLSDDPAVMEPNVQRSIGSSAAQLASLSLFTIIPVLLATMLHWSPETFLNQCWLLELFFFTRLFINIYKWAWTVCVVQCVFDVLVWMWSVDRSKKKRGLQKHVLFFLLSFYKFWGWKFSVSESSFSRCDQKLGVRLTSHHHNLCSDVHTSGTVVLCHQTLVFLPLHVEKLLFLCMFCWW